jgi:hypothetical protein
MQALANWSAAPQPRASRARPGAEYQRDYISLILLRIIPKSNSEYQHADQLFWQSGSVSSETANLPMWINHPAILDWVIELYLAPSRSAVALDGNPTGSR